MEQKVEVLLDSGGKQTSGRQRGIGEREIKGRGVTESGEGGIRFMQMNVRNIPNGASYPSHVSVLRSCHLGKVLQLYGIALPSAF